jgi:hypothetical protein
MIKKVKFYTNVNVVDKENTLLLFRVRYSKQSQAQDVSEAVNFASHDQRCIKYFLV